MAPRKAEQVAKLRKEVEQVGQELTEHINTTYLLTDYHNISLQLQRELEITRKPLSETIQELVQYTKDNIKVRDFPLKMLITVVVFTG